MRLKFNKNKRINNPFIIQEGRLNSGRLEGFSYRKSWTENSFVPDSGKGEIVGKTFNTEGFPLKIISFIILFFLSIIIIRVAWLQIVRGDYYYSLAEGNRIRIKRIEPKRGVIYDRNYNSLVKNTSNFLLYFIPADLPKEEGKKNEIIKKVSIILGNKSYNEINNILIEIIPESLESYQPLFIDDNIEYEKAMILYLESEFMPGVILLNKAKREYNLYSLSLSHILGYTSKINKDELEKFGSEYSPIDYIGKTGIEYFWENELKGNSGKKHVEVNALGKEKKIISKDEAEDGHNLVLSIDIELQKKLEEVIIFYLTKLKVNKASAIIMNPNNGEILAMVSLPSYNNNTFARGITSEEYKILLEHPDNPLFNRAISGEYPSGSTIKPVMAAAALEEGIINEHTSFNSVGGIRIGEWFFPDWKSGGHGITDVCNAIAQSVNTFFYYIGGGYEDFSGLGVDKINNYSKLFGLGLQTGIDLSGESAGFLPTKEWKEKTKGEPWYIGDTYHISIGQGDILVTPLQVANFTSIFANGGNFYRPHLVKQVLTSDDKLIGNIESSPIRSNFVDSYNISIVRQGMRQTVTNGSASSLQSLPVAVAGKTGTAQWSSKKPAHAWFTGFAPYENPEIVITILIEEGGGGDIIATPIAKEVLDWYFSRQ